MGREEERVKGERKWEKGQGEGGGEGGKATISHTT